MKNARTAALGVVVCCASTAFAQAPRYEGFELVWADEFNKDGPPDPANWVHEIGFVRNQELQYYQPENARCEKGMLIIEGRREKRPNPAYVEGSTDWRRSRKQAEYTSACITTRGKQSWLYGRFEMRARIGVDSGLWPAWWTLGTARPWPGGGEIDIMEYYRRLLLANLIFNGKSISQRVKLEELGGEKWAREFHVWRMDWDRDRVKIWVDDRLLCDAGLEPLKNADAEGANSFREPHYMLLNLAIGGGQGGAPSQGLADPSGTTFPSRFEVDYVRVHQKRK